MRGQWQQGAAAQGSAASALEVAAARKLAPQLRAQLLICLRANCGTCALCGDLPEEPVLGSCGHAFCAQCATLQARAAASLWHDA